MWHLCCEKMIRDEEQGGDEGGERAMYMFRAKSSRASSASWLGKGGKRMNWHGIR